MTAEAFDEVRPSASIAYRTLGSVSEAEDVVQEGFLRLHRTRAAGDRESPRAYLSTVVSRLSLDHRARRGSGTRPTWASGCRSRSWRAPTTIPPARPRWRARCRSPSSSSSRAVARAARRLPAARGVRRALRADRGDRRHERAERPPARHTRPPPRGGAAPPVRGLARAAGGAREPLLRGRRGGRPPRARGAAGPRRRLP